MPTIAVDAMGGDRGVGVTVKAAIEASRDDGIDVVLVGERQAIQRALEEAGVSRDTLRIEHAGSVIDMGERPTEAVRRKADASIQVAFRLLRDADVDGVVTAGHSGAAFVSAILILKRMAGVRRPALLVTLPSPSGDVVLLDVGANVEVDAADLVDFARLGHAFARASGVASEPRVALVGNGRETSKGTRLLREAAQALANLDIGYEGFVESHELFDDRADVAVCDGFVGNVLLKGVEGGVERAISLLREGFSRRGALDDARSEVFEEVERQICYTHRGGAVLAGVDGLAVVAHGRSGVTAVREAIRQAHRYAERDLVGKMQAHLESLATPG